MVQNSIDLLTHAFRDSEFADFLARAQSDPDALTAAERVRWDAYMTAVYRHFGNLVYQFRMGALDQQVWGSYRHTLRDHLQAASWADWYQEHSHLFSSSLTELVDELRTEISRELNLPPADGSRS